MHSRIEVFLKDEYADPLGKNVISEIETFGLAKVKSVRVRQVYIFFGKLTENELDTIAKKLLADSVTQHYLCTSDSSRQTPHEHFHIIEVSRKPGVMDPVEQSVIKALRDINISVDGVKTAHKYMIDASVPAEAIPVIAAKVLANTNIEDVFIYPEIPKYRQTVFSAPFKKKTISLINAQDVQLEKISAEGQLSLNIHEMRAIQQHYTTLRREPTDIELETIAQTWSEHCVHKTMKGRINFNGKIIDNLLKNTVMKATEELNAPWCVSVFKDNAGIIEFDEEYNVCFKVETHNHPSAIEPYGGANTGIGGVIRDIMGTGLGAKPILNTDVFCFGMPDTPPEKIPKGALHPKKVFKGVVAGVRDYGNRMGIPTVNGAIYFDERYIGNPIVFCGTAGIIPKNMCQKESRPDDLIVVVGGRTGRDGIHGATFSSAELNEQSEHMSGGAVQIGNAITEKMTLDTLLQARDRGLYNCITDCGAGGLSSAVGEMGQYTGACVYLEKVPLKYEGLSYAEIWISESQERMVLSVPKEKEMEVIALFNAEDVEATVIGHFTDDKMLRLYYQSEMVGELEMDFLHNGLPRLEREAIWNVPGFEEPSLPEKENYGTDLKKLLSEWNICSKEWVIRQYDHEVQGGSVLKPLQGVQNDGPGDASIIKPVLWRNKGIIVSNGMNPRYGDIDPYHMAASAIDEALRQIISVGGNLKRVALLDNFCWGNTNKPDRLGSLVMAAQACYDIAVAYGTPFISGKDSLNNEFITETETIVIPPTLLISAISVLDDVRNAVSMNAKEPGNLIYLVGVTRNELGGSHYYYIHGHKGKNVPVVNAFSGKKTMNTLSIATAYGIVRSCHDCSEGGLAVAAAEMAFAGGYGMELDLSQAVVESEITRNDTILFSESNTRFLVEVKPEHKIEFEAVMKDVPHGLLGKVRQEPCLKIIGLNNITIIEEDIYALKEAWQSPLRW
ncbi:phosphoribosylformylglycinamidine synthase subunit PurL [uncultured Candidatus Kuenenia sp.]|jgi:phosphoribosylformylglycinamidine synthase|uniref:phosphoribosylformylglycinamidine synthase subunit PurL n=1 Tax=uncultured Candidatus Kuenenia sp. TaxID=1048336 RepID=UPI0025EB5DF3|nr:phosphoribosylformylglycinamidine synthase subunit PurL [uncultured Candidatus Kuenenia sp.]